MKIMRIMKMKITKMTLDENEDKDQIFFYIIQNLNTKYLIKFKLFIFK